MVPLLKFLIRMCVCVMHHYIRVIHAYMYVNACGGQRLITQHLSFKVEYNSNLAKLASSGAPGIIHLYFPNVGVTDVSMMPSFLYECWGSILGFLLAWQALNPVGYHPSLCYSSLRQSLTM